MTSGARCARKPPRSPRTLARRGTSTRAHPLHNGFTMLRLPVPVLLALLAVNTGCASAVFPREDGSVQPDVVILAAPDAQTCNAPPPGDVGIALRGPGATPLDCNGPRPQTPGGGLGMIVTRTAAVVSVRDDATQGAQVTLDFCSPLADCTPMLGTLTIRAAEFTLGQGSTALQPGQYVRIRSRASWSFGCTMQVEVSNAARWDGDANPVRADDALLAAASSGDVNAFADGPFGVRAEHLGCVGSGESCGSREEQLALAFQGHCNTCIRDPDPVIVRQGDTGVFEINEHSYVARNLRSFTTSRCDDSWNYAWTARETRFER